MVDLFKEDAVHPRVDVRARRRRVDLNRRRWGCDQGGVEDEADDDRESCRGTGHGLPDLQECDIVHKITAVASLLYS